MPSAPELKKITKDELYDLLSLKAEFIALGYTNLKALDKLINKKQAGMDAEDVAYVEKKIAELK